MTMERKTTSLKNKTPFRLPLRAYLSYLLVFTLIFTAVSFAKFATSGGGSDGARVAGFSVDAIGEDNKDLSIEFTETTGTKSVSYLITAYNYTENNVTEVAVTYDVVVTVTGGLPDGVSVTLDGKAPSSSTGGVITFATAGTFAASVESSKTHTLTFTGDSAKINTDFTGDNRIDINIDVKFEQID